MRWFHALRPFTVAAALVTAAALPACDSDDPTGPDEHAEEVDAVRLTIGTQIVEIDVGGNVTGGPVVIAEGSSVPVSAVFVAEDGDLLDLHDDEFELRLEPASTGVVTFTRTGPFAGTLTGVAAGQTQVEVLVWHLEEDHEDFEQFLTVTVQ